MSKFDKLVGSNNSGDDGKKNVKEVIKKATMKKTNLMHTPNRKINSMMQKATSDDTEDKGNVEKEDTLRSLIQGEALIKG